MPEAEAAASSRVSEQQYAELAAVVRDLQDRVAALERQAGTVPPTFTPAVSPIEPLPAPGAEPVRGLVAVVGKSILGLAGAYLLRAISESGTIPALLGALVTVVYAACWLIAAWRAGARDRMVANLFGATAAAMVFPMLWETTVGLHLLTPPSAAILLLLFASASLAVAWRDDLTAVVWITAGAGSLVGLALLLATQHVVPLALALLAVAAGLEATACRDRWMGVRAVVSLAADLAVFVSLTAIARPSGLPESYAPYSAGVAMALAGGLLAVSLAGTVVRTLVRGTAITKMEVLQLAIAVALAMGGGLRLAATAIPVGVAAVAGGAACYLVSFAFLERHPGTNRNFYVYSTLALILVSAGSVVLLRGVPLTAVSMIAAVASTGMGNRWERTTVRLHGVLYLLLGCAASGVIATTLGRILAYPAQAPPPMDSAALVAVAGSLCCYGALLLAERTAVETLRDGYAALFVAGVLALALAGLLAGVIPGFAGELAVGVRTALLSSSAILLAFLGKRWNRRELSWLVYPAMALTIYKLVAVDLRHANAVSLSLALLFVGAAFLLLPRLLGAPPAAPHASSG